MSFAGVHRQPRAYRLSMDPALWPWLALGIGVAAGLATGLWIIRDDRPTNVSGWATAGFASLLFGTAVGFGVWAATRVLSLPWWPMVLLLGGLGALGYARIGLAYAAWEWRAGDPTAMGRSLAVFVGWPVLVVMMASMAGEED